MITHKEKELIKNFTFDLRKLYNFSFIPSDQNYKTIECVANSMSGGIEYSNHTNNVCVCRCGSGFIAKIPKTDDITMQLKYFAEAIYTLFFQMYYKVDNERYMSNPNMEYQRENSTNCDFLLNFMDELICPEHDLRQIAENCCDKDGELRISDVAKKVGLNESYVEHQLVRCNIIKHWLLR